MFLDNLTENSVIAMDRAREEALRMGALAIDLEHVLLGLLSVDSGIAYVALRTHRLSWKEVREKLHAQARDKRGDTGGRILFAESVEQLLIEANHLSQTFESEFVDTEHLLLALLDLKSWRIRDVFDSLGHEMSSLRSDVVTMVLKKRKPNTPALSSNFQRRVDEADSSPKGIERFNEDAIAVLLHAQEESRRMKTSSVGSEQLLLGIIGAGGKGARLLVKQGLDLQTAREEVEKIVGLSYEEVPFALPLTPRAKRIIQRAWDEAQRLGHNFISPEHLLLGLICDNEGIGPRVLENKRIDLELLHRHLMEALKRQGHHASAKPDDSDPFFMR
jgi:ATP-dependent Clp protease ATP-binding subunit ClpA